MGRAVSRKRPKDARQEDIGVNRFIRVAVAVLTLLAAAAAPAAVLAHAELMSSSPADGAQLDSPPNDVSLVFDDELLAEGTGFTVTDADGNTIGEGELDLSVADRNEIRGDVTITEEGTYHVAWKAVSADGHAESGELTFTVGPAGSGASPNTAVAAAEMDPALLAGGLLLVAATALELRRRRRASR